VSIFMLSLKDFEFSDHLFLYLFICNGSLALVWWGNLLYYWQF